MHSLQGIAQALGGEVTSGQVLAPGPNHSRRDRSLSIRLSPNAQDGFLVFSHCGDDFRDCRDYVKARLGLPQDGWRDRPTDPTPVIVDDRANEARIARATALWNEAADPRGTIVEAYLASRGLDLDEVVSGHALRFHPACPWKDEDRGVTIRVPAMVAAMRQISDDRLTAVHRTRLTPEGAKVDRRMLGVAAGTAIKLDPDTAIGDALAIGEGIESVMSGRLLGFRAAWAMASAGAIGSLPVRSGVSRLDILAEHDPANARAANTCGSRWHEAGREVRLIEPRCGNDMNDALREVRA